MKQPFVPYSRVDGAAVERKATAALAFVVDHFLLLPIGVLIALTWANIAGESYFRFAHALRFSVNDIGMAFFVGLITEEVLEAVMPGGALYRWRRTLLPVVAALGGVLGATAVYLLFLQSHSNSCSWTAGPWQLRWTSHSRTSSPKRSSRVVTGRSHFCFSSQS